MVGWVETEVSIFRVTGSDVELGSIGLLPNSGDSIIIVTAISVLPRVKMNQVGPISISSSGNDLEDKFVVFEQINGSLTTFLRIVPA